MGILKILPSRLSGSVFIPSSKSHTLRALLFASLARGISQIENPLSSPDTQAMIQALQNFGCKIEENQKKILVHGGAWKSPEGVIDCGNSGLVLRLIGALCAHLSTYTILTGDHSIRTNRVCKPLLEGLSQLGVFAVSSKLDGYAPVIIRGPILGTKAHIDGEDSQPVSGLIIAGAFGEKAMEISVNHPGEKPWIDLTLYWLDKFSIPYTRQGYYFYRLEGGASIEGFSYQVPGDFSSAAFAIAAALMTSSELLLQNMDMDDVQGDKQILNILEKMGALFAINSEKKEIKVLKSPRLQGISVDMNDCIDALPIMAAIATQATGKTVLYNARIARKKESDRITCIANELRKMGANIEELEDGLVIENSKLSGARVFSHHDHRIALSLAVAGLVANGETFVEGFACTKKTYESFFEDFKSVGAHLSFV